MKLILRSLAACTIAALLAGCGANPPRSVTGEAGAQHSGPAGDGAAGQQPGGDGFSRDELYRLLVAELAGQRGELERALQLYLEVARETRDAAVAKRATHIAVMTRSVPEILEAAQIWLDAEPANPEVRRILAISLIRAGRAEEALGHLGAMLGDDEDDVAQGLLVIAALLARENTGADADAVMVMQELAEKHAEAPEAHLGLAQVAISAGDNETAIMATDRALALRPDWTEAVALRASALRASGQTDAALEELDAFLEQHPDEQQLLFARARMLVEAERYEEARQAFEGLLTLAPDNVNAVFALGVLTMQQGMYDDAHKLFVKLEELEPENGRAQYYLGQIEELRDDFAAAVEWYRQVPPGHHRADAELRLAISLARLGRIEEATEQLHKIDVEGEAQRIRLRLVESDILVSAERLHDALSVLEQALERIPGNDDLLYAHAMVAEKLGDLETLERDLGEIIQRDPENARALNALGYTLTDRTDRHREALQYIRRAYELQPDDAAIVDSMGWVHFRLGDHQKAVEYLEQALEMRPDDPEIAAHLGEALWVVGRREEARAVWKAALQAHPGDTLLHGVIERLTGARQLP